MNLTSSEAFFDRMESQKFKFSDNWNCFAKSSLVRDLSVPAEALRLYLVLQQVSSKGYCSMSNASLSEVTGIQLRTLQRCLAVLRSKGWITVQIFNNRMRKIFVRTDKRETAQNLEYIDAEFDKRPDCNKEDGTQFGDNENENNPNTKEQDEARDADTGEEIISFEAKKSVQQAELIPPETECRRGTELAVTEEPMDVFERTLWKHPETCEYIKQSGSVKAKAFRRWCKITKDGKLTEVCDLLRTQYRKMVDGRKRQGTNWNALEVFLNPVIERWKTDWDSLGAHTSAFVNTAPRGVTVLNRTTARTVTQATATIENGTAEVRQATETVSETATVLGGDNLHLRDDYQNEGFPRDWVTLAVEKKLSGLNLSKGIIDGWRKIANWKFCPKELKQAAAALYDEGYRYDVCFERIVPFGYKEKIQKAIVENAEYLAGIIGNLDGDWWWKVVQAAQDDFDRKHNYTKEERDTFDTFCSADGTLWFRKPEKECIEPPSEWMKGIFPYAEWLRENSGRIIKNQNANDLYRFISRRAIRIVDGDLLPEKKREVAEIRSSEIKTLSGVVSEAFSEKKEQKRNAGITKIGENKEFYLTDDDFQKHTKPKFWFGFLKKYAKGYETKSGMIDTIRDMVDWVNFPKEMMSFLRMAFRMTKGGLGCIGAWSKFRMKNLYLMAEEEMEAVGHD